MLANASTVSDYYARLGVEPGADRAAIEAALVRMQPAWSMGTRNPKTRHANQLYLDEIPALRKALLSDTASRAAYDAELAMIQAGERERKLGELERRVRLRAAKGGLTASDRKLLSDEAARLGLSEDDVVRITRMIPNLIETVTLDAHEPDQDPPADVLDPSTRRQIRAALEHLGCRDLYDALGVARDAPVTYIVARADAERQRWMKKAQVTAEKTAWLEIITHAQSHLSAAKTRARYDRTLVVEIEESFDALAAFALDGLVRLDPGTRSTLIEEASALGIPSERALRLIARICRRCGVTRDRDDVAALAGNSALSPTAAAPASVNGTAKFSLLRCRHCSGVTEMSPVARKAGSARCRHCGASLKWDCPICKRNQWVDERRCTCGFRQALCEPLVRHFEAAQQAFRNFDLARAMEHLERVQEFAPNLAGAQRHCQDQAKRGRYRASPIGLPDGVERKAADLSPRRRRGLDPPGRSEDPRPSSGVVRAHPGLEHGRNAGNAGPKCRADEPVERARALSPEPGDRRRPARGPGWTETHASGPAGRSRGQCDGRSDPPVVDAALPGRARSVDVRDRSQTWRHAGAPRRRHEDRRGEHGRV